jgi:CheY-like chemotaxis protein
MWTILQLDDNPDDLMLVKLALEKARLPVRVHAFDSAEAATRCLKGCLSEGAERSLPDLVLLDIRMPGTDGIDFLTWLRASNRLRQLPVYVLTGVENPVDRGLVEALGVRGYFLKSPFFTDLVKAVALLISESRNAGSREVTGLPPAGFHAPKENVSRADGFRRQQP